MFKRLLIAIIAALGLVAGTTGAAVAAALASPAAPKSHALVVLSSEVGALAYAPSSRSANGWGLAGAGDVTTAVRKAALAAYAKTKAPDSQSYIWFSNGYGSIARGSNNAIGSGWGPSQQSAEQNALNICSREGGTNCRVIASAKTAHAGSARGGTPGRVCFFLAPDPANFVGHVGFAYRTVFSGTNPWVYGSTEGKKNASWRNFYVPPGKNAAKEAQSWALTRGTFSEVVSEFYKGGPYKVGLGHYKYYRCGDTASANPTQAWNTFWEQASKGFGSKVLGFADNNCLTHAIATLRVYGATGLPSGVLVRPNSYFNRTLGDSHGAGQRFLPAAKVHR